MYIACPQCDTKFMVLPEQIGNFGRKVKCSKCGNIWHQKLVGQVKVESVVIPDPTFLHKPTFGNGVNLPALLPIKIPQYLCIMPFIFISLIIILSAILLQDSFSIKSILHLPKLNIKDVHVENQKDLGKIIISYKVMNSSPTSVQMPLVRIRLFDKNNCVVKTSKVDQTNVTLAPNQYVNIKTEFVAVPASTKEVDITLGNKLDFILR